MKKILAITIMIVLAGIISILIFAQEEAVIEKLIHTDANFRVAFIGDQGLNSNSIAVLNLIKDEGAQMVLHQGDLDYEDDPDAWDKMVSNVLGYDFPYFVSVGNHDVLKWDEYQQKLHDRLEKVPDAECIGDLGVKSSCIYKGLHFIQVAPAAIGSGHSSFIESQLNNSEHIWRICSFAGNMNAMQVGEKKDIVGWEVYNNCKNDGAIIATAHEHSYHRTKTLIDIENQIIDPEWPEPDKLRIKEDSTFVFVSGIGGHSIRNQDRCLPLSYPYGCNGEWAEIYTSDQNANHGALFCTFNVGGQPNKVYCYFKNIDGRIIDAFTITSFLGTDYDNTDILDMSDRNLTGDDLSNRVIIDGNLSNAILVDADLSNSVLIGTTLTGADFTNANLTNVILNGNDLTGTVLRGSDLTDANLNGIDLSDKDLTDTVLRGSDLTQANLSGIDLSGRDLTGVSLSGIDLSGKDLTGTILRGADLSDTNLAGVDLSGKDLTGTILKGVDLSDIDLAGTMLRGTNLSYSILTDVNLSGKDLEGTILKGVDLSDMDMTKIILEGADLSDANLSGQDLSDHDLTDVILTGADLSNSILPDNGLAGRNFDDTIFNGVNLSGKNLSFSTFRGASFDNANMENTDLSYANFLEVDLTKIKSKSLAGANLSNVIFAYANLSGNNLDGAALHRGNFQFSNLSGTDFTGVSSGLIQGATFIGADLSDTNFEGISFVVKDNNGLIQTSTNTFINMVHMVDSDCRLGDGTMKYCLESWKKIKKSKNAYAVVPLRIQVSGDDVTITFVPTFEFDEANLRGANLSGSDLTLGFLILADLTNADLSSAILTGADLTDANLTNADLSSAILTGADLTDANLTGVTSIEAVLNCKNHPICVN